jgi:hypothetical protein
MKKLIALISAVSAVFVTTAKADVAVSGSAILGLVNDGAATSNKTEVRSGGAVSFALSTTTANGMTISGGMGITMDTDAAAAAGAVSGLTAVTFASGGMTTVIGSQKVAGRDTGAVGSVTMDFIGSATIGGASAAEVDLDDVKGQGIGVSTSMGDASVAFTYIWDASPTQDNEGFTDASDTGFGISAAIPMGDLSIGVGYAGHDDGTNNDTTIGANVAYAVAGGTLTVGYQSTTEPSNNATSTGAKFVTSLDADTSVSLGYKNIKEGAKTQSKTSASLSRSLGGGASVFAEIDNRSGSGGSITTGSAFSIGTSVSF